MDKVLQKSKEDLFHIKSSSIRNMVYMNMRIPYKWTLDNTLQKVLDKDENLKSFYETTQMSYLNTTIDDQTQKNQILSVENFHQTKKSKFSQSNYNEHSSKKTNDPDEFNEIAKKTSSNIYLNSVTSSQMNSSSSSNNNYFPKKKSIETVSLPKIIIKKKLKTEQTFGPFLNVNGFDKKIEIKNPLVKKLLEETENHGPYYTHCPSCQNRNLSFFQYLKENEALRILKFIKEERLQKQNKKLYIKTKLLNKPLKNN